MILGDEGTAVYSHTIRKAQTPRQVIIIGTKASPIPRSAAAKTSMQT